MIHGVLVFNNDGKPRLMNWYIPMVPQIYKDIDQQMKKLQEIHSLVRNRPDHACNFLEGDVPNTRIVYRVPIVDLSIMRLCSFVLSSMILRVSWAFWISFKYTHIDQVFVESLDKVFTNVCELDLVRDIY
jgi:AP-3 complex subunit sigma